MGSGVVALITAIAGVVLAAAGITKVVGPGPAAQTLTAIGLRGTPTTARLLGIAEAAVGLGILVSTSWLAPAAGAIAYLSVSVAVVVLRRRSPTTPCGCFGQWSEPPSMRHVVVTTTSAVVCAIAAATDTVAGPPAGSGVAAGVGWWLLVAVGAAVVVVALTNGGGASSGTTSKRASSTEGVDR